MSASGYPHDEAPHLASNFLTSVKFAMYTFLFCFLMKKELGLIHSYENDRAVRNIRFRLSVVEVFALPGCVVA